MEVGLEVGMEVNVEGVHLQMEVCWWLAQLECGDNDTKARRSIKIHGRAAWKEFLTSVLCLVQISTDIHRRRCWFFRTATRAQSANYENKSLANLCLSHTLDKDPVWKKKFPAAG